MDFYFAERAVLLWHSGCLSHVMMPTLIEISTFEHAAIPHCTREQARQLLEDLRTAYQSLSLADRGLIRSVIAQVERTQFMQEMD